MNTVILSRQAKKDLDVIYESPLHARRQLERMLQRIRQLGSSPPPAGAMIPEIKEESLCQVFEGRYRIVYRNQPHRLEVVTIMHALKPPAA